MRAMSASSEVGCVRGSEETAPTGAPGRKTEKLSLDFVSMAISPLVLADHCFIMVATVRMAVA
jgi:hypothetical protein